MFALQEGKLRLYGRTGLGKQAGSININKKRLIDRFIKHRQKSV